MTEEINQEIEQELEEVKVGQEDKSAEGYEVLTDEDLNPDYEPTEEANIAEESNEAQPTVDAKEEEPVQKDSPKEVEDQVYNINGASYSPEDIEKMAKDYTNLTSFMGKQAEELGKYKERANNLEAQNANSDANAEEPEKKEAPVEVSLDKDYDIYSKEGIAELANDMAEKKFEQYQQKKEEENSNAQYLSNVSKAQEAFMKEHPEYKSEDDVVSLIQDGAKAGVAAGDTSSPEALRKYLELAHATVKDDFSYFSGGTRAKKSGGKVSKDSNKTIEKVMEANKVDSSLSDVNSDGTGGADYDKMGFDEWEKLPDDKRYELLGITKDSY
jgi:type II secretory pathway pseudopilin PulG